MWYSGARSVVGLDQAPWGFSSTASGRSLPIWALRGRGRGRGQFGGTTNAGVTYRMSSISSEASVWSLTRQWIIGRASIRPATRSTHVEMKMFMYLAVQRGQGGGPTGELQTVLTEGPRRPRARRRQHLRTAKTCLSAARTSANTDTTG